MADLRDYQIVSQPFPASTKTQTTTIHNTPTTATTLYFADKILITITQNGRLAHWVRFPVLWFLSIPRHADSLILGPRSP